jgi:N-acetylmuramoyl-L-alanine amidase
MNSLPTLLLLFILAIPLLSQQPPASDSSSSTPTEIAETSATQESSTTEESHATTPPQASSSPSPALSTSTSPPPTITLPDVPPIPEEELDPTPSPESWKQLDPYHYTLTRTLLEDLLNLLFDPQGALRPYIRIDDASLSIYDQPHPSPDATPLYTLRLASSPDEIRPIPRSYRTATQYRALPKSSPLEGLRIAIDPGHIGGSWGPIEMRSIELNGIGTIQEGDFNIITARLLREQLQKLGATVFLTRETTDPVTSARPSDLYAQARRLIYQRDPTLRDHLQSLPIETQNQQLGQRLIHVANYIFSRTAEKIARAQKIRSQFQPDITLVLYFNATPASGRGQLTTDNRNTFFIHGCYLPSELQHPAQRLALLLKLVSRTTPTEFLVASRIAEAFTRITGLPPVLYGDTPTTRQLDPQNPYVVARNLAANREYPGPVVITEPFFMNNRLVALRLLAGDYDGLREFDGVSLPSIYRQYAQAVTEGLVKAYAPSLSKKSLLHSDADTSETEALLPVTDHDVSSGSPEAPSSNLDFPPAE